MGRDHGEGLMVGAQTSYSVRLGEPPPPVIQRGQHSRRMGLTSSVVVVGPTVYRMNRHIGKHIMLRSFVKKASKRWSYCVLGLQVMCCHTCTMPVALVPSPTGTRES